MSKLLKYFKQNLNKDENALLWGGSLYGQYWISVVPYILAHNSINFESQGVDLMRVIKIFCRLTSYYALVNTNKLSARVLT